MMDLLWAMFGAGIMTGIVFWTVLDIFLTYWRERLDFQRELWAERIEAERYIVAYEAERKKNE